MAAEEMLSGLLMFLLAPARDVRFVDSAAVSGGISVATHTVVSRARTGVPED